MANLYVLLGAQSMSSALSNGTAASVHGIRVFAYFLGGEGIPRLKICIELDAAATAHVCRSYAEIS